LGHCRDARYVWNLAVDQHQYWQPGCKAPGYVVAGGNRKSQAVFECEACTAGRCNADVNAARNIAAGRAVTARGDLGASRSANREPQLCAPAASVVGGVGIPWSQPGEDVKPARLACATVPAYARDSKWSPTPTANHNGAAVRSQASDACPGRQWVLL